MSLLLSPTVKSDVFILKCDGIWKKYGLEISN